MDENPQGGKTVQEAWETLKSPVNSNEEKK